ncbi:MAG: dihydroorotate dehydrogenase [Thermodesulfovibrionales bacterium]
MNLAVDIGRLRLKNPVMTASGTFGYGEEYAEFVDPGRLGAVVAKGLSLKPTEGNPPPRTCETPCGMLNAIGFQNVGVRKFIKQKLPWLRRFDTRAIANILGATPAEYVSIARLLDDAGIDAIELNVSCPNVKKGGISFCADLKSLGRLVEKVRGAVRNATLIVKLSPNVTDIRAHARVAESAGAEALSLINTLPAMAIDLRTRRPLLGNITGGLSGPAIKPVALRAVWEVYNEVDIPLIGMGGISTAQDALEFMVAGATAVAVGTASFVNPSAAGDVVAGMEAYMRDHGVEDINELIGTLVTE